jgi:hypothetical protein
MLVFALCAIVYYRKTKLGRLYPKAARTGPYAYAQEVTRVGGKVVTKYLGIVRIPEGRGQDVIEKGGGSDDNTTKQSTSL